MASAPAESSRARPVRPVVPTGMTKAIMAQPRARVYPPDAHPNADARTQATSPAVVSTGSFGYSYAVLRTRKTQGEDFHP